MASHRRLHDKTTAKQSGYTPPPSFNRQQATGNETTRNHTALVNAPQTSGYPTCLLHRPPSPGMRGQHSEPAHVTNERQKNRAASLRLAGRPPPPTDPQRGPAPHHTRPPDGGDTTATPPTTPLRQKTPAPRAWGARRGNDSNQQPYWARRASRTASRSRATIWSATTSSVERAPTWAV